MRDAGYDDVERGERGSSEEQMCIRDRSNTARAILAPVFLFGLNARETIFAAVFPTP